MTVKLEIQKNISLADFTTFKIGGLARFFVEVKSIDELIAALSFAASEKLPVFVLGGGSNILVSDQGFIGLVIKIGLSGISVEEEDRSVVLVTAEAGEEWDNFVEFCVENDFAGVECLSGIPGLVGGTPIQNVGAYGQEASESIVSVQVFDRRDKEVETIRNSECGFEYRKSIFNTTEKDRYIVLRVTYRLKRAGTPKIVYADLKDRFNDRIPTLRETREAVLEIREKKGMRVRQGGFDAQSAGSFFKNPIISKESFEKIRVTTEVNGFGNLPFYVVNDGYVKVPAAWLIENAGFAKGFRMGNAGLSTKHSLALSNQGGAAASEILDLKNVIEKQVKEKFGIELTPEPNFVGFTDASID